MIIIQIVKYFSREGLSPPIPTSPAAYRPSFHFFKGWGRVILMLFLFAHSPLHFTWLGFRNKFTKWYFSWFTVKVKGKKSTFEIEIQLIQIILRMIIIKIQIFFSLIHFYSPTQNFITIFYNVKERFSIRFS